MKELKPKSTFPMTHTRFQPMNLCRDNQWFFPISLSNKIAHTKLFIEYANVLLIFFQTKLLQNFVKLLTEIIAYLYRCS